MQSQWHSICSYLEKLIFLAFAISQRASSSAVCRELYDCAPSLHLQGDQQSVCGKTNIQSVSIVLPLYMKAVAMCCNFMTVCQGNPVGTRLAAILSRAIPLEPGGCQFWISVVFWDIPWRGNCISCVTRRIRTWPLRTTIMLRSNRFSETYRRVWNLRRGVSYRLSSTVVEVYSYRTVLIYFLGVSISIVV